MSPLQSPRGLPPSKSRSRVPLSRQPPITLEGLLAELDQPLENIDWRHVSKPGEHSANLGGFFRRLRQQRQHRRALRKARRAAQTALGVTPRHSARKHATLLLTAGAATVGAMSGMATAQHEAPGDAVARDVSDQSPRKPAALLKASGAFKQALIEEEGVRYTVYRDVAGYPTVGVGHLITPDDGLSPGDRVGEGQVMEFLERDLRKAERGVRSLVGRLPLHQHEFDALLDLVYNVGRGNVDERDSPRLNAAIEAGDYDAMADELIYRHAAGEVARGLEYRSERRTAMFAQASYEDPRA